MERYVLDTEYKIQAVVNDQMPGFSSPDEALRHELDATNIEIIRLSEILNETLKRKMKIATLLMSQGSPGTATE